MIKLLPTRCLLFTALFLAAMQAFAGEVLVSAAASLTNAFKEVASSYEDEHADTKVLLNFAASGVLLQQIANGAPVDVFASADQETMDMAEEQGLVASGQRRNFANNALVLVVPAGSSVAIGGLDDLSQPAIERIAIANPDSVPAGRYAKRALEQAGLWPTLGSRFINTQNVRQSLDYVARGEVDAGFVYATDAILLADSVKVILEVPLDIPISYPITTPKDSANRAEAARFIDFVLSPKGQAILNQYGFSKP